MATGGAGWATTLAKEAGTGGVAAMAGTEDCEAAGWEGGAAIGKRAGLA